MIQYIYFVKCPNCEDEHFDFFDDAKGFALGCLSKKPIITQTEVCRNDFGECTDSSDLGTVWSWEDEMKDAETEEPGTNVLNKGDFSEYNPDNDPEFADDNFDNDSISTVEDAVDFLVKDEEEAIAGYEKVEDAVKDFDAENKEEILDTIDHIKEEEEEHIEELRALLDEEEAELVEHINEEHPAIESDQKLDGTDNAVADCKVAKVISHSEDEKPVDCEGKKKPLEKPLTEGFVFSLANEKDLAEFTKLCQEVGMKTIGDLDRFAKETANEPGNILDKLRAYRAELGDDFEIKESRKPVPEGMTIEQLVEEMEENEDEVECTWCNDLFPKDMCKKEVNLGYLCPRCADGIMSRGETLTFKENNYWDFLDEDADTIKVDYQDESSADQLDYESDFFNCFDDEEASNLEESWLKNGDKFTLDFGNGIERYMVVSTDVNSAGDDKNDRYIIASKEDEEGSFTDEEQFTFSELAGYRRSGKLVLEAVDSFDHHDTDYSDEAAADALADRIDAAKDKRYDDAPDSLDEPLPNSKINEDFDSSEVVNLEYDELTVTLYGPQRDADDWDEVEHSDSYTYTVDKGEVATTIWENFITEEDAADVPGGLETLEDNDEWDKFLETHFDILFDKYYNKLLDYYEDDAADEFRNSYSYSDHYADLRSTAEDDAYDAWRDEQWD